MLILKPLTIEELRTNANENNYVEADVIIGFDNILEMEYEEFFNTLSEAVTGSPCLMDISYEVVGIAEKDNLIIRVRGDVSEILETE